MNFNQIKLIAFDIGGTLIDWNTSIHALSKVTQKSSDEIHFYLIKYLPNLESGKLNSFDFWDKFISENSLNSNSKELMDIWIQSSEKILKNWDLVKEFKNRGYKIAICSNSWSYLIKLLKDSDEDFELFDYIFDSSQVGFVKPQREYFEFVENQTGYKGQQILLIDDSETNLIGAKKFGWQTRNA